MIDGTAYGSDRRAVSVTEAEIYSEDPERALTELSPELQGLFQKLLDKKLKEKRTNERDVTTRWILRLLLDGAKTPEQAGRRAFALGYDAGFYGAPESVRDLARVFGVSSTTAFENLTLVRQKQAELEAELKCLTERHPDR